MGFGGISIWSLILIFLIIIIPLLIFRPVIRKAGYSGWWTPIIFIPFVNLVMIWIFAFVTWPNQKVAQSKVTFEGNPKNEAPEHIYDPPGSEIES